MSPKKHENLTKTKEKKEYSLTTLLDEVDRYICAKVIEPASTMVKSGYDEAIKKLDTATSDNIDEIATNILTNIEVKSKLKLAEAERKLERAEEEFLKATGGKFPNLELLESSESDGEGKGRHHNKKNKKEKRTFKPSTRGSRNAYYNRKRKTINDLSKIFEDNTIVNYGDKKSTKKNKIEISEEQSQERKIKETLFKEKFFPEADSVNFIKRDDGQVQIEINEKKKSPENAQTEDEIRKEVEQNEENIKIEDKGEMPENATLELKTNDKKAIEDTDKSNVQKIKQEDVENSQNIKLIDSNMSQKEESKTDLEIFKNDAINIIPLNNRIFSLTRTDSRISRLLREQNKTENLMLHYIMSYYEQNPVNKISIDDLVNSLIKTDCYTNEVDSQLEDKDYYEVEKSQKLHVPHFEYEVPVSKKYEDLFKPPELSVYDVNAIEEFKEVKNDDDNQRDDKELCNDGLDGIFTREFDKSLKESEKN